MGEVTLTDGFPNNIAHFSFGMADYCKRGGGSRRYNPFRPIFTVAPLSGGCTSKSGKIKLTK